MRHTAYAGGEVKDKTIEFELGDPVAEMKAWLKDVKLTPKQQEKLLHIFAVAIHDSVKDGMSRVAGCCFAGVGQACPVHEKSQPQRKGTE